MTDIEVLLSKILNGLGYRYYEQYEMEPYIVDFFLPEFNMVIEADGEPWHSAIKDRKRDLVLAREYGVVVLRFAGKKIKKEPEEVSKKIKEEIDKVLFVWEVS